MAKWVKELKDEFGLKALCPEAIFPKLIQPTLAECPFFGKGWGWSRFFLCVMCVLGQSIVDLTHPSPTIQKEVLWYKNSM